MIRINDFIKEFPLAAQVALQPWELTAGLSGILAGIIPDLDNSFTVSDGIAVHTSAIIEAGVVLKPPVVICAGVFIGAHAYLRGGVYLGPSVSVGPGCEVKTSVIAANSALAHFNFIGDSLIGHHVNFEAGSLTANYHNDRADKRIYVNINGTVMDTGAEKFGSLVGDRSKIGANAVLSPGTMLPPDTVVGRLELVDQGR